MTQSLELHVSAIGPASATAHAKARAAEQGWRIRTVASVRECASGWWTVRLAVTRPAWLNVSTAPSEAT